jgi:hypothetical protein
MLAYSGPFVSSYRTELVDKWRAKLLELKIPHSEGVSMSQFMGEPVKI